ncbi:hypothetical protein GGI35DRAFT_482324 [Trichoderma velutinum]
MSSSSTGAIYNGSSNDTESHTTTTSHPSHGCGIDRFLADQEQRCPPEFGKTQSPAEAEAAAEAQMTAKLLAFDEQFGSSPKQPGSC